MKMMKSMLLVALFMSVLVFRAFADVPEVPPAGLKDLGVDAAVQIGSGSGDNNALSPNKDFLLKKGERTGEYKNSFAFHTISAEPWIIVTLKATAEIRKIYIQNRADACQERAKGMTISVSNDQKTWKEIWKADDVKPEWTIDLKNPENAKYIKFELPRSNDSFLHLNNVRIYGN